MSTIVKARIEADLKAQSESVLKQIGLDMSAAIKVFLIQVVQRQGLPFEVTIAQPNALTLKAIEDSYSGKVETFDSVAAMLAEAAR